MGHYPSDTFEDEYQWQLNLFQEHVRDITLEDMYSDIYQGQEILAGFFSVGMADKVHKLVKEGKFRPTSTQREAIKNLTDDLRTMNENSKGKILLNVVEGELNPHQMQANYHDSGSEEFDDDDDNDANLLSKVEYQYLHQYKNKF